VDDSEQWCSSQVAAGWQGKSGKGGAALVGCAKPVGCTRLRAEEKKNESRVGPHRGEKAQEGVSGFEYLFYFP
jgi:hypothetical protein